MNWLLCVARMSIIASFAHCCIHPYVLKKSDRTMEVYVGVDAQDQETQAVVVRLADSEISYDKLLSTATSCTTVDTVTGMVAAISEALMTAQATTSLKLKVMRIMVGNTQVLSNRKVQKVEVSVIRLCGNVSRALPPFCNYHGPATQGTVRMAKGGFRIDQKYITPVDKNEINEIIEELKAKEQHHVVISGVFAQIDSNQEELVELLIENGIPDASITLSSDMNGNSILERENNAVDNEMYKRLWGRFISDLHFILASAKLTCPVFVSKEDGTVVRIENSNRFPIEMVTDSSHKMNAVIPGQIKVSGKVDKLFNLKGTSVDEVVAEATKKAKELAIEKGADGDTLEIVQVETKLLPGLIGLRIMRVMVEAVGDLIQANPEKGIFWRAPDKRMMVPDIDNCVVVASGSKNVETKEYLIPPYKEPYIDPITKEWILSNYDVDCISLGAGIVGCGGGGNLEIGRLRVMQAIDKYKTSADPKKRVRVINPKKLARDAEKRREVRYVSGAAFMGAPAVLNEMLVAGTEIPDSINCMHDLYVIGNLTQDGVLVNSEGIDIEHKDSVSYVNDYQPTGKPDKDTHPLVALMNLETAGFNCLEPLANVPVLDIPVADCDLAGRAVPEYQMTTTSIYGQPFYPSTMSGYDQTRHALLRADLIRLVEDFDRDVAISQGQEAGMTMPTLNMSQLLQYTVLNSISRVYQLGNAVIMARRRGQDPIAAIIQYTGGKILIAGTLTNVNIGTQKGFTGGDFRVTDSKGQWLHIDVKNENIIVFNVDNIDDYPDKQAHYKASMPDLITLVETRTGNPIQTDDLLAKKGEAVTLLGIPCNPMISTPQALKVFGPQAFGYHGVTYVSVGEYVPHDPVPPEE